MDGTPRVAGAADVRIVVGIADLVHRFFRLLLSERQTGSIRRPSTMNVFASRPRPSFVEFAALLMTPLSPGAAFLVVTTILLCSFLVPIGRRGWRCRGGILLIPSISIAATLIGSPVLLTLFDEVL